MGPKGLTPMALRRSALGAVLGVVQVALAVEITVRRLRDLGVLRRGTEDRRAMP